MPEFKNSTNVFAFIWAVFHHWTTLMSGGIITVALGIFERFSGKNVPLWVYGMILIFFVFLACYLAWRDERRQSQVNKSKQDELIKQLQDQAIQKARRKELREQLGELFREGDQIRWGMMTQKAGAHEDHSQWLATVRRFLSSESEFDNSHLARFDATQLDALNEFIKEFN